MCETFVPYLIFKNKNQCRLQNFHDKGYALKRPARLEKGKNCNVVFLVLYLKC